MNKAFTVALRDELAPYGIDVTKLNPGPYATGFNDTMVNGIAGYIEEGDAPAVAAEEFIRAIVLTDQADPDEVVQAMADPTEEVRNNAMRTLMVFADAVPSANRPSAC